MAAIAKMLASGSSLLVSLPALAQDVLPPEPAPFGGTIHPDRETSVPSWPAEVNAPKGAPNVIVILLDDTGFGTSEALGGPVHTPAIDQLAHAGLLYNNFHVTALCSPTRAALLSGRNDHQVGFGNIAEAASGFPGYNSIWPKSAASIAEVLKDNGYSTAAFGKWHNTPTWEVSVAGPFDRWPTGLGFEYFYGFMAGQDDQWRPRLYRNTYPVEPSKAPQAGYHLTTDLTDDAIRWMYQHDAVAPEKPFFLYFATGATHKPHHVAQQWIAKYKGKFDGGWDKLREETFRRQKALGVIPMNAELTPRPKELPAWDSLSSEQKKLLAHQAEVFAGFMEQTDYEVGRLLQAVRDEGQWDNTLVLFIVGDNGASAEGGLEGDDKALISGKRAPVSERLKIMDKLGSDAYMNHYSAGWAWGFDAPFQWTKQVASHLGGTTDPLIVSWPAKIRDRGAVRGQFQHVTDIAPTIYQAAGIAAPDVVNGVKQMPLEGASFTASFTKPDAPSEHHVQIFETLSNRAIYKDGWWAGKRSFAPWEVFSTSRGAADEHPWELYDLTTDYSQAHDLAAARPDKLKELTELFDAEARRTQVYPIMSSFAFAPARDGDVKHFVFRSGVDRIQPQIIRNAKWTSHTISADVLIPAGKANGVIIAQGGRQGGYTLGGFTLYLKDGHVVYEVMAYGNPAGKIVSRQPLKPGKAHIVVDVDLDPIAPGNALAPYYGPTKGTARLSINGEAAGETKLANFSAVYGETLDVGKDLGSPVSRDYEAPFALNGAIDKVVLDFK